MAKELKGAAELHKKLELLGQVGATKIMRSTLRAAMQPAKKKAQEAAKTLSKRGRAHRTFKGRLVAPGFASRNLRIIVTRGRGGENPRALLGVRAEAYYAVAFLELGTSEIPKTPWLVPSFEAALPQVMEKMVSDLKRKIERASKGKVNK